MIKHQKKLSATFHARDLFGPIAGRLSLGEKPKNLGRLIKEFVKIAFPLSKIEKNKIYGEVLYIDHFGNLITNIPNEVKLTELIAIPKRGFSSAKIRIVNSYCEGKRNEPIVLKGSCGYYEIAVYQESAQALLKAEIGFKLIGRIRKEPSP